MNQDKNILPSIDKSEKVDIVLKIIDCKDKKLIKRLKEINKLDILKLKYITENLQKFAEHCTKTYPSQSFG